LDSELNEQQEIINFERRKIADILFLELENLNVINFGRSTLGDQPVNGSNCSLDYDYYLGRKDIVYATTTEIKRLEGAPADFPKLPIVPEGTLGMCSIDCPPNSTDMQIRNFGLTRITMDQIHDIIQDLDDFSNSAQSDIYHEFGKHFTEFGWLTMNSGDTLLNSAGWTQNN
jgi:hypothetical protein